MGNVLDCEAGLEKAVRGRVSAAWKKMDGDGEFDNKQKYSIKDNRQCTKKNKQCVWEFC